jgi:uroporphyrinogen-III decarboxylase
MDARERVLAACAFRRPDRIPRIDNFWEVPEGWEERLGEPLRQVSDVAIWCPDEGTFPTRARVLEKRGEWVYEVDTWGRTVRRQADAYFSETLQVALPPGADPERLIFDPPDLDARFALRPPDPAHGLETAKAATAAALREARRRHCVFGKTGGPYLRSTYVRGETQFLMDIAADPSLARTIADRVGDLLTAVGIQEIERWALQETGIWIFDDMAYNNGPMVSPGAFERVFLPAYRRMIRAYKEAGARYVFFHSDGDVRLILPMLVDAGIDGLNPLEPRAHMDVVALRQQYPDLILAGGMDNSDTLLHGPAERVRAEARAIIDLGRDGGVIIGTHSISPEIPFELFYAYHETCRTYGVWGCDASGPTG